MLTATTIALSTHCKRCCWWRNDVIVEYSNDDMPLHAHRQTDIRWKHHLRRSLHSLCEDNQSISHWHYWPDDRTGNFQASSPLHAVTTLYYLCVRVSHRNTSWGCIRKYRKYIVVDRWPIWMNGYSTGHLPIHLRMDQVVSITKNICCFIG